MRDTTAVAVRLAVEANRNC